MIRLLIVSITLNVLFTAVAFPQPSDTYTYDLQGRISSEKTSGIKHIEWNNFNKIIKVVHDDASQSPDLEFRYNAKGERTHKIVKPRNGHGLLPQSEWKCTYYQYDVTGVLVAVYEQGYQKLGNNVFESHLELTENKLQNGYRNASPSSQPVTFRFHADNDTDFSNLQPLGVITPAFTGASVSVWAGEKHFELTNNRHDVLAVITDRKAVAQGENVMNAELVLASDYDAFGMSMPGRISILAGPHRYGFAGKEHDDEIRGSYNSYDFGARMYDPRLGRWLSIDPLTEKYPSHTPYNYVNNNPLNHIDPDGNEVMMADAFMRIKSLRSIYQLAEKNSVFSKLIKPFQGNKLHLAIGILHSPSENSAVKYGEAFIPKGKSYAFAINDIVFDKDGNALADPTIIFQAMVHEAMHLRNFERQRFLNRYPGIQNYYSVYGEYYYHHELMAAFNREEMVSAMKEFDNQRRANGESVPEYHTEDWYNAIAWGGINKLYADATVTLYSDAWREFAKNNPEKAKVYTEILKTERERTLSRLAPENIEAETLPNHTTAPEQKSQ